MFRGALHTAGSTLQQASLASLIACELLALAGVPSAPWPVLATLAALLLGPALVVAFVAGLVLTQLRRLSHKTRRGPDAEAGDARLGIALAASAAITWAGLYASSVFSIYGPYDVGTYVIDAFALAAAGGSVLWLRRSQSLLRAVRRLRIGPSGGAAIALATFGALSLAADRLVFPSGYFGLHAALWAAGAGFALAAAVVVVRTATRSQRRVLGLCAALVAAPMAFGAAAHTTFAASGRHLALHSQISHRALMRTVWRALDRDGDGFSARLGGADCDDADPGASPLSPDGHDCTGLLARPRTFTSEVASSDSVAPRASPPQVVLLLTIDAFRCGFGGGDDPELAHACPELTRLGRAGRLRLDAHTTATQTRWAIGSLFGPRNSAHDAKRARTPSLPATLAGLGYRTVGLPNCRYAAIAAGVDELATVDTSLVGPARNGAAITAPDVNRAILDHVTAHLTASAPTTSDRGRAPLFLWAHYMDPHAPYLAHARTRWVPHPRANYAAEIRRVDAAIGELVRAIDARVTSPGGLLLFVTADHGEEFGEHGLAFHGAQVYEESSRIPMVAWWSGHERRRDLPGALPAGLDEVGGYLVAAITGAPFAPRSAAVTWAPIGGAVAIVKGNLKLVFHPRLGLFEAYDLARDPGERSDLATHGLPEWARELGVELVSRAPWLPGPSPLAPHPAVALHARPQSP